jgi:hypothetical protein
MGELHATQEWPLVAQATANVVLEEIAKPTDRCGHSTDGLRARCDCQDMAQLPSQRGTAYIA